MQEQEQSFFGSNKSCTKFLSRIRDCLKLDEIPSWIHSVEVHAHAADLDDVGLLAIARDHLKGQPMSIYKALSTQERSSWQAVKNALLRMSTKTDRLDLKGQFFMLVRKKDEHLLDYSVRITDMAKLLYPEEDSRM